MKIVSLKCPGCGADINVDYDRKIVFCEYCGKKIFIDDEIKRTEHTENINVTYRKIDEAKLREADVRIKEAEIRERRELRRDQKRITKKKRHRFVILAILILIAFGTVKGYIASQMNEAYAKKIGKQVKEVCDDCNISVDRVRVSGSRIYIDILAASSQKDDIDAAQKAVIEAVTVKDGYKLEVSFDYPENHTVREISVNEYGKVDIDRDYTNTLSPDEITKLVTTYEENLPEVLEETGFSLYKVTYEADTVNIDLKSETREKKEADNVIMLIKEVTSHWESQNIQICFEDKDREILRETKITKAGKIETTDDYCNSISDVDAERIEREYIAALKPACKKVGSELTSVKMRGDILYITIAAEDNNKETADKVEDALEISIEGLTIEELSIEITTHNKYNTVREWTVDKNGMRDVIFDFTR